MAAGRGSSDSMRWVHKALGPTAAVAWAVTSIADLPAGLVPASVLVVAAYLFVVLLPRLRVPSIGTTLVIGAATIAPIMFLGGQAMGMAFGLIALTLLVHARRHADAIWLWIAYVVVACHQMLNSMSVRTAEGRWSLLVVVFVMQLPAVLAWGLGNLLRKLDRRSAERVATGFEARERTIANDIHDLVSRPLTATTMMMRAATSEDWANPRFQRRVLHQLEDADQALRTVTAGRPRNSAAASQRLSEDALENGAAALVALGFRLERAACSEQALRGLPPEIDSVVARAVAEALHNAAKHGDSALPVRFAAVRTPDQLDIEISNGCSDRSRGPSSGRGLAHIRTELELLDGTASADLVDGVWTQAFALPLGEEQTA